MALGIETFSSAKGGAPFFKAVGHPLAAPRSRDMLDRLAKAGPVAVYDPLGLAEDFAELYDCSGFELAAVFVQDVTRIGRPLLGRAAQPVTDLAGCDAKAVLIVAFDAGRLIDHVRHLVPAGAEVLSLDAMR